MKFGDLFREWKLVSVKGGLKIKNAFLEAEWKPKSIDKDAAWDMYVELLTRITTQPLPQGQGVEEAALESVHSLFATTRSILKERGRECVQFSKVAVIVLNQVIRPFTTNWHGKLSEGKIACHERELFRKELSELQQTLVSYVRTLSVMAEVEDITGLEEQ